eukprot:9983926-Prorocentrum_lima.AAC.1
MQPRRLQYWPSWRNSFWRLQDSNKSSNDSFKLQDTEDRMVFEQGRTLELVAYPEINEELQEATILRQRSREE